MQHQERLPKGATYFFLSSSGKIVAAIDTWTGFDNLCHEYGNYFSTRQDAEAARSRVANALKAALTGNEFTPYRYGWLLALKFGIPETIDLPDEYALHNLRAAASYMKKRTGAAFRITKVNGGAIVERLAKGLKEPENGHEDTETGLFATLS